MKPPAYPGRRSDLSCPECSDVMVMRESKHGPFYGCSQYPRCRGTHGAHPDGSPLGTPADAETKQARIEAHVAFDQLWKDAARMYWLEDLDDRDRGRSGRRILKTARSRAYGWLAEQLGISRDECHIGSFDAETCRLVVELCSPMQPEQIRAWAKEQADAGA